ncbi:FkbM family methyltransferase [Actinoalloteichus hymeniacidonis]|uniref:Methyltransferase, FkbM family n=1 Tax=Actinoalloteichus hymeniacidonis TaxID=340345 RepID=A0AAC9HK43_9PSEU|nr:FkbM family methyltransferase [Actinoalloteichus hymeniacidonis]AOS60912.1 methyltransferase, FkbM family [Actinoalloteichus hymeniacidonis]MBB5911088.1 FkbM family methyltransferase [Actinoalloteichus hymeniacidonis]
MSDGVTAVACTIVAKNYLPAARVLAQSFREHHPEHEFVIAVIDREHGEEQDEHATIVGPDWFGITDEDYLRMATSYTVMELATAVKPYLLRTLRERADVAIYLDPDIQVFSPFGEVVEHASTKSIVLTPHTLEPIPQDGLEPDDAVIMGTGIYNLGFIAVGAGSEGFLDFWASRLRHDAIAAPEQQLFTDQRWVDQAPALFPHYIWRDPGLNVAYWNVWQRPIEQTSTGGWTAAGRPLRFFHFSGYRPEKPWLLTFHCARKPRTLLSDHPALRALCDGYGQALLSAGYADSVESVPYRYNTLADDTRITPIMRRVFRAGWIKSERAKKKPPPAPPHAFGVDGGQAFRDWLTAPDDAQQAAAGLSRWTMAVWQNRPDLQIAFPQPWGADAEGYRHWCVNSGVQEKQIAPWALPTAAPKTIAPLDRFGVNLLGYLTAELGLGEMARIVHDAISHADIPIAAVVEDELVSNRTDLDAPDTLGDPRFPVSLIAVNADQLPAVSSTHAAAVKGRYRIGLWAWELEEFPESLHGSFDLVDEIWTVSEFCREAIARHSPVPVRTIPVPVRDPGAPIRRDREEGEKTRFLFAFDFNSVGERKNPWGLVTAFQRAFPDRSDVQLTIKAINAALHPEAAERLRSVVQADARIELLERYLPVDELRQLYADSDCYVSLHRSEGFGLTVAEAMMLELPTISTDYSSTTEFLNSEFGWPIPHTMTTVGPRCEPYQASAIWAEPDLDAAAKAMREVADDPAEGRRRGRAARAHLLRTRNLDITATWMREQLERAYASWQGRGDEPEKPTEKTSPMEPLRQAREALRWRADTEMPSRNPLAPAMRRAVLRAVDHYDVHQRRVLGAVTDGVESSLQAAHDRIDDLTGRIAELHQRQVVDVDEIKTEVRTVATRIGEARRDQDEVLNRLETKLDRQIVESEQMWADHGTTQAGHTEELEGLRKRVEASSEQQFAMFTERDQRADHLDIELAQAQRDLEALHALIAARHTEIPPGSEVVVCDAGALLMPADEIVMPWIRHHRSWELDEAELIARLAGDGTFLDIGAHVGYHSLRLLTRNPSHRVITVEANPTTVEYLRRNINANLAPAAADRVIVLPVAAWDTATKLSLLAADPVNSGDYRVSEWAEDRSVTVPAVALGSQPEVTEHRISLIKVDLQGRDHRALAGLRDLLGRDHPHVVCEFCPEQIEELTDDPRTVLAEYRSLGYRIRSVAGVEQVDDEAIIEDARASSTGFSTLWLDPSAP